MINTHFSTGYLWFALPIVMLFSFGMTGALRLYALKHRLIDVPNSRSSHSNPTPRGGGVAIVICFLLMMPLLALTGLVTWSQALGVIGAGTWIALIGFLDDHGHIAARWRLLAHFLGAIWALFWVGGLAPVSLFGATIDFGWIGHALAAFYLVWMLNLYNFMDGIDGIAGVEAVTTCVGACLIYWLGGYDALIWTPLLLTSAVIGFLCWNFPPAKIFMGDAGSGFLGIMLGVFSLQASSTAPQMLWVWLILLGVFIVDATFTLLRRLLRGDKVYEAHRSHAYQFASREVGGHRPVTLSVMLINLAWLLPIGLCVGVLGLDGLLGLVVAYVPLVILAVRYHAGELEMAS
jgi:Fuc2NAc and GlcNAc transferase